ncbi:hypothetical protein ACFX11_015037 [Malus domestica]
MHSRPSHSRLSGSAFHSRISALLFTMVSTMAAIYVAGRLWQDAADRVYLIQEIDRRNGQGQSAVSVDDTLKIIACREQQKQLSALEMQLTAARQEGFVPKSLSKIEGAQSKKKLLAVIGIITTFDRKKNREAIRKAWMPTGEALKRLADEKGIIVRFVIGRSPNRGDSLDKQIDEENERTNDFIILDDQVEASEERPKKTKSFYIHAVENWDAEFYVKVNDDVYVNIDVLGATLTTYLDKPHVYIGCMKSGEVFSEPTRKWYEPDWWKFGDAKSYFRHASGELYAISRALAQFISINRSILRAYAHDDVSAGSWFIGLDVKHIDERKFCCSSWMPGKKSSCCGLLASQSFFLRKCLLERETKFLIISKTQPRTYRERVTGSLDAESHSIRFSVFTAEQYVQPCNLTYRTPIDTTNSFTALPSMPSSTRLFKQYTFIYSAQIDSSGLELGG